MDKYKLFYPSFYVIEDLQNNPEKVSRRSKFLVLSNGNSLRVNLKISKCKKESNISSKRSDYNGYCYGKISFTPSCLSLINLDFELYNSNKEKISNYSWSGFYFDLNSTKKKNLFTEELRKALIDSFIFCMDRGERFYNMTGNLGEFNFFNEIKSMKLKKESHRGCNENFLIDLSVNKFLLRYKELVSEANNDFEKINLNLTLIEDSKTLCGDIEECLEKFSYDPEKIIKSSGTFAAFWGDGI